MQEAVARALPGHDGVLALEISAAVHVAGVTGVPVVFEEAELAVLRDQYLREPAGARRLRRGLTWWKYARFVRRLCRQAAFTTVVSEAERAILGTLGCDLARVAVVPNGVDVDDLDWPRPPQPARRVIYPGSLTYSANLDAVTWFLDSMLPIVRRDLPDVDVWVTGAVGDARLPDVFADARPTLTGNLPDVRPAIAGSAVCVVPLRLGGGTRLKILQAMALGTPVVATSKGAEGLDVTPGRDILIGDTPDAFAAHVIRLLNDPGLADTLSTAARALVRSRYTWARCGAILDEVVQRAVTKGETTLR
jgi:glycosyltransferase involved in cell wall biosynthesis